MKWLIGILLLVVLSVAYETASALAVFQYVQGGTGTSSPSVGQLAWWGTSNLTGVSTSTLTASSPLTGSFIQIGSSGSLGCQTASGSQAGCLSSTDWTTFNNKQAALTFTWPLVNTANTVSFNGLATSSPFNAGQIVLTNGSSNLYTVASSSLDLPNSSLQNSSITVNGTLFNLGDSHTITAASSTLLSDANTWTKLQIFNGNASTTVFSVSNGLATTTISGSATSSFGAGISGTILNLTSSTASSTFSNGLNITGGCFSVAGTCLTSGGAVSSVSNSDGTLTISPTTGAVVASIALAHANTWTALQQFNGAASTSQFSVQGGTAWFGGSSTTTISNTGAITTPSGVLDTFPNATTTNLTAGVSNYAINGLNTIPFYMASSSWGSGTTTITIMNNINNITWVNARCNTSAGTLETRLYTDTVNNIQYWSSSTTINTLTFGSNNVLTTATTTYLDIGNAASSPTNINCTLQYVYNGS